MLLRQRVLHTVTRRTRGFPYCFAFGYSSLRVDYAYVYERLLFLISITIREQEEGNREFGVCVPPRFVPFFVFSSFFLFFSFLFCINNISDALTLGLLPIFCCSLLLY